MSKQDYTNSFEFAKTFFSGANTTLQPDKMDNLKDTITECFDLSGTLYNKTSFKAVLDAYLDCLELILSDLLRLKPLNIKRFKDYFQISIVSNYFKNKDK